jgi:hypothetical protein
MDFDSIEKLREYGFEGFRKISYLMETGCNDVPPRKGVYLVCISNNKSEFLNKSVGGHFKGKDPTVSTVLLKAKWVESVVVLYIGKAGGGGTRSTLCSRLKQYMKFGQGNNIGHRGGRYIWQLSNYKELSICWKALFEEDPRQYEKSLIAEFKNKYGKLPFANLQE